MSTTRPPANPPRLRQRHSDAVRAKIQASQLINRLQGHVNGTVNMTPSQVKAAEILLRKSVPDLCSMELSGEVEHTGEVGLRPVLTRDQWLALHKR